jgi:hypothetical protein
MTLTRGTILGLGLALGAACLAVSPPVRADGEDQARKACRQIAKNRDWKDVDADVRREGDRRVLDRQDTLEDRAGRLALRELDALDQQDRRLAGLEGHWGHQLAAAQGRVGRSYGAAPG